MQMAKCLKCLLLLSHTFLAKQFFQRVWGVYKIVVEIPEGWRGLCGIPSMVGVWIFSGTTQLEAVNKLPSRFPVFTKFIPAFYRTMSYNRRFTVVTCIHLSSILEDSENTEPCRLYGVKNCYNILFGTL